MRSRVICCPASLSPAWATARSFFWRWSSGTAASAAAVPSDRWSTSPSGISSDSAMLAAEQRKKSGMMLSSAVQDSSSRQDAPMRSAWRATSAELARST